MNTNKKHNHKEALFGGIGGYITCQQMFRHVPAITLETFMFTIVKYQLCSKVRSVLLDTSVRAPACSVSLPVCNTAWHCDHDSISSAAAYSVNISRANPGEPTVTRYPADRYRAACEHQLNERLWSFDHPPVFVMPVNQFIPK